MYEDLNQEIQDKYIGSRKLNYQEQEIYERKIQDLEASLAEAQQKILELNTQAEQLSKNLLTEQETSNNLLISSDTAQSKIEEMTTKRDMFILKVEKRDLLIKEYEETILELTEMLSREKESHELTLQN